MSGGILSLLMFGVACGVLLFGFPVAFSLAGVGLAFALIGNAMGFFDMALLGSLPSRYFGVMTNELYVAVPLFVFMGIMLEKSRIAEKLLTTMGMLFGSMRAGLGISVVIVGMLLAASTGIVGATVVTMGLLSLPAMQKAGYSPRLSTGVICASGTLGQIIPPSIVLVLLGDILQGAYAEAQRSLGNWAPEPVSVMDLFAGAFIPGLLLVGLYISWVIIQAFIDPKSAPALMEGKRPDGLFREVMHALVPPATLIIAVLGSILMGIATPTESAAFGGVGATVLAAFYRKLSWNVLKVVTRQTVQISAMVFVILLGASIFSLVFRGLGGDHLLEEWLHNLPGGVFGAMLVVMLLMFVMGFFLDFIEIVFVVVPIVGPILLKLGVDPVWLGVMIAVNLQTSFLTPPFGFALFYLRGVAPAVIKTWDIYRGIIPFVMIQLLALCLIAAFPALATWLPGVLFR
ncbi:TRAP transporter large permease subunit [Thalassospira sp.]|uniref:TRAP transporter large permease n=1 Tax=Thalassospira sp. TaxID=1912094 RepID=UPI0027343920|nr:TRAP transporter large permease subunit [Thalassospira sp.]MDP2697838.1 TRAP transporter large permease subunit [Thalassospira sp.]